MKNKATYYPRPQLKRNSFLSLDGQWLLNKLPINVPYPPESKLSMYEGNLDHIVYEKSFDLQDNFINGKVLLHFGAIDQIADIFLNGVFLAHNEGGYLPIDIDVTKNIKYKDNYLKVIVKDTLDYFYPYGKQSKKPHGMWYTEVSGIWQSVWLESYPIDGIDNLTIQTNKDTLYLDIDSRAEEFVIEINNQAKTYHEKKITIKIDNPHLWNPNDPYLYKLKIKTSNDEIESYFALRQIDVINNKIFLNDEPLFICGLLDQGYFKDGIFVPNDMKEYETDVLNMKELGFNCLRKHIKLEPEVFYAACDKYGMLVIQDMVNSGKYSFFFDTVLPTIGLIKLKRPILNKKRFNFFIDQAKATIKHLKSHPCIIGYTIYNEGWGQQGASKAYDILKPLDQNRLFDSTSGWFFDNHSDFDSYHVYFKTKVLKQNNKPLLLSECGGFTRNIQGHQEDKKTYGYGSTDSEDELTERIIDMYDKMVIPSIHQGLCGYIYTQVSDVEGEINGLYTFDRKVCKVNKTKILQANINLQKEYKDYVR